jgi:hypothetical protein
MVNEHRGPDFAEIALFWILAGILLVLAFGDFLTLLAGFFAVAIPISWVYRAVERRLERNDAEMAPVSHLRPALTSQSDLKKTSAHVSWHGPWAA